MCWVLSQHHCTECSPASPCWYCHPPLLPCVWWKANTCLSNSIHLTTVNKGPFQPKSDHMAPPLNTTCVPCLTPGEGLPQRMQAQDLPWVSHHPLGLIAAHSLFLHQPFWPPYCSTSPAAISRSLPLVFPLPGILPPDTCMVCASFLPVCVEYPHLNEPLTVTFKSGPYSTSTWPLLLFPLAFFISSAGNAF